MALADQIAREPEEERWVHARSYGTVWHRVDENDRPICGAHGPRFREITVGPPATKYMSYICCRCYRIERGLEFRPFHLPKTSRTIEDRIEDLEQVMRVVLRVTGIEKEADGG